jgi:AcrR family transcriptional regulator
VRQHILDAARDLYAADGYRNVTMRRIAERIEYTAPAIYSYFPSRDAIFTALAEQGLRLLLEDARAAAAQKWPDPLTELRESYWRYYEYSRTHREYFMLVFVDPSVPPLDQQLATSGFVRELTERGPRQVQACIDAGLLPAGTDPAMATATMWAAIHGAAVIRLWGGMGPAEAVDALARQVLDNAIAGLRGGVPCAAKAPRVCYGTTDSGRRRHAK